MKIIFYLTVNTDKPKIIAFLVFACLKFRLPKMPRSETPSWLRSQNSKHPRIFRVTGANQNARKALFTDLANTKKNYADIGLEDCYH